MEKLNLALGWKTEVGHLSKHPRDPCKEPKETSMSLTWPLGYLSVLCKDLSLFALIVPFFSCCFFFFFPFPIFKRDYMLLL